MDLDAPISDYLASDLLDGLHRLDGVDHTGRIAVRHLLSQTSGLPDYFLGRSKGVDSYAETITQHDMAFTISRRRSSSVPHPPVRSSAAPRQTATGLLLRPTSSSSAPSSKP